MFFVLFSINTQTHVCRRIHSTLVPAIQSQNIKINLGRWGQETKNEKKNKTNLKNYLQIMKGMPRRRYFYSVFFLLLFLFFCLPICFRFPSLICQLFSHIFNLTVASRDFGKQLEEVYFSLMYLLRLSDIVVAVVYFVFGY